MPGEVTGQITLELHLERYNFAADHAQPGRILDIACGVGYGTPVLYEAKSQNREAIGVDCSEESIVYAREKYSRDGIQFVTANAMNFEDHEGFDTIVSLETIEHVPDPFGLITHLIGLLRPGGIFVGSVPTTPTVDANPHHLHDFTERSFRELVEPLGLSEAACFRQTQSFEPISVLTRKEYRLRDLRKNLGHYYVTHPSAFFDRIWSTVRYGFTNRYVTIAWRKNS